MSNRAFTESKTGRALLRVAAPHFTDIPQLIGNVGGRFVLFVAADTAADAGDQLVDTAETLLRMGAVAVHCWGRGSGRLEHSFDQAAIQLYRETDPVILTSSSEGGDLEEAIWEGVVATYPADGLDEGYERVVVVIVGQPAMVDRADAYLQAGVPLRDEA